jgi:Holliday junction resolvasome RuvABC ATP-dependent DNA helicase subunit
LGWSRCYAVSEADEQITLEAARAALEMAEVEQFIVRTPRGRMATARAYQVLGRPMKSTPAEDRQPGLFD